MSAPAKDEMSSAVSPDKIIEDIGGCGRFQVRMTIVVHLIKTIVCFTFSGMIILSATPAWWCEDEIITNNLTSCLSVRNGTSINYCPKKACAINGTECQRLNYDSSLNTIVSDFNLVCARDFIPSTIMSVQVAGTLVGNIAAGQIADLIGRRLPFFTSILLIMSFNIVGYFSTSWQMFTIARFFLGMGGGFFLTTQYCFLSEFSLARWRVWIVGFPSWPIQACVFSLFAWLLHDWRDIQMLTAIFAVPCLLAWFALPESFRWYIAHDNPEKAEKIIKRIAKYNKHEDFDIDKALQKPETREDQRYTILHLFNSKYLIKVTVLLSLSWIALGVVSYGISFGIQSLSGSIYLNVFLFSLTGIPSKSIALWLQNRFGRRAAAIVCFVIVAVGGLVVGIVQTLGVLYKDELTNGFAMVANMGIAMAWGPIQTMTIELYPTVIRNIGFGTLSVTGRVGAILGPQLVYLNSYIPGLLYYVCGAISVICVVGLLFLPETMNKNLNDKIKKETEINFHEEIVEVNGLEEVKRNTILENEKKVYVIDVASIPDNIHSIDNTVSSTKL